MPLTYGSPQVALSVTVGGLYLCLTSPSRRGAELGLVSTCTKALETQFPHQQAKGSECSQDMQKGSLPSCHMGRALSHPIHHVTSLGVTQLVPGDDPLGLPHRSEGCLHPSVLCHITNFRYVTFAQTWGQGVNIFFIFQSALLLILQHILAQEDFTVFQNKIK